VLVAAAICPHPPLLVPEVMGSAGRPDAAPLPPRGPAGDPAVGPASPPGQVDAQLRLLRAACYAAVGRLARARPGLIAVVGGGSLTRAHPATAAGSLRGLGAPVVVGDGEPVLPLSLTIGAWLLRRCLPGGRPGSGAAWRTEPHEVATGAPPGECEALGAALAGREARVALLVLADGSARRALGVPGAPDPGAEAFDALVARALGAGDAGSLARLDPRRAEEVMASGRAAWQVLAGAAGLRRVRARLWYAGAPLDVGYAVASWELAP